MLRVQLSKTLTAIEAETSSLVLPPNRHGYEESRRVFNSMVNRRPSAVVRPRCLEDAIRVVRLLVESGIEFTVRGGGHSIAGTCVRDDVVMLDMSLLRRVTLDENSGIVTAEPGALWCDYDAVTTRFGLASTGGIVSHTGVAGLTLGGGLGWLMGEAGLACDALVGVTASAANGETIVIDEGDADLRLFRGGGRSLGVVTELRFRPIGIPEMVTAGRAIVPLSAAAELFWRTHEMSSHWPSWVTPSPAIAYRDGKWVGILDFVSVGALEDTTDVIRRCLPKEHALQTERVPYSVAQQKLDTDLRFGRRNYWKSLATDSLSPSLCEMLAEHAATAPSTQTFISVDVVHGAATWEPPGGSVYALRNKRYVILFNTIWSDAADDVANIEWCRRGFELLTVATGESSTYSNYFSEDDIALQDGSTLRLSPSALARWTIPCLR